MICPEGYGTRDPTSGKRERNPDLFLIQKVMWYKKNQIK